MKNVGTSGSRNDPLQHLCNNTSPSPTEIAALAQREARLKAKQQSQRRLKEEVDLDEQLLAMMNRRKSRGASNQVGVTARQSSGLSPHEKREALELSLRRESEGEMDGLDDIIDNFSEEADSPRTPKKPKTDRGGCKPINRGATPFKELSATFTHASGAASLDEDEDDLPFTTSDIKVSDTAAGLTTPSHTPKNMKRKRSVTAQRDNAQNRTFSTPFSHNLPQWIQCKQEKRRQQ